MNQIALSEIQGLLLRLVEVLKPLAQAGSLLQQEERGERGPSSFVNRLFIPPSKRSESTRFSFNASLLTTLETAQNQIEHWIQEPPAEQEQKRAPDAAPPPRSVILGEVPLNAMIRPAQTLIDQVRIAIQTLSTSANLEEPKVAHLRETMKRLKPFVDALIEAVGRGDTPSTDQHQSAPPFRHPIPAPLRERFIFKKELPLPFAPTKKTPPQQEPASPSQKPQQHARAETPTGKTPRPQIQPDKKEAVPHFSSPSPLPKPPGVVQNLVIPFLLKEKSLSWAAGEGSKQALQEVTVISAAPYLPEKNASSPRRKEKKKRKGFWTRDDEEEKP